MVHARTSSSKQKQKEVQLLLREVELEMLRTTQQLLHMHLTHQVHTYALMHALMHARTCMQRFFWRNHTTAVCTHDQLRMTKSRRPHSNASALAQVAGCLRLAAGLRLTAAAAAAASSSSAARSRARARRPMRSCS